MFEDVCQLLTRPALENDFRVRQIRQAAAQLLVRQIGDLRQQAVGELTADRRPKLNHPLRGTKLIETGHERTLDRAWNTNRAGRRIHGSASAICVGELPGRQQSLCQLLREERHSVRLLQHDRGDG